MVLSLVVVDFVAFRVVDLVGFGGFVHSNLDLGVIIESSIEYK
jgi:hypothetical protein